MRFFVMEPGGTPASADIKTWTAWCQQHRGSLRVAHDTFVDVCSPEPLDIITVSTIFTGVDVLGDGSMWETMVLGGKHDRHQRYSSSQAEARAEHAFAVALVLGDPG